MTNKTLYSRAIRQRVLSCTHIQTAYAGKGAELSLVSKRVPTYEHRITRNQFRKLIIFHCNIPMLIPAFEQLQVLEHFQRRIEAGLENRFHQVSLSKEAQVSRQNWSRSFTCPMASRQIVSHGDSSRHTSAYAAWRALPLSPSLSKEDWLMLSSVKRQDSSFEAGVSSDADMMKGRCWSEITSEGWSISKGERVLKWRTHQSRSQFLCLPEAVLFFA